MGIRARLVTETEYLRTDLGEKITYNVINRFPQFVSLTNIDIVRVGLIFISISTPGCGKIVGTKQAASVGGLFSHRSIGATSAIGTLTDIPIALLNVRFRGKADICRARWTG